MLMYLITQASDNAYLLQHLQRLQLLYMYFLLHLFVDSILHYKMFCIYAILWSQAIQFYLK